MRDEIINKQLDRLVEIFAESARIKECCPKNAAIATLLNIEEHSVCHRVAILKKEGRIQVKKKGKCQRKVTVPGHGTTDWTSMVGVKTSRKCLVCLRDFMHHRPKRERRRCPDCTEALRREIVNDHILGFDCGGGWGWAQERRP